MNDVSAAVRGATVVAILATLIAFSTPAVLGANAGGPGSVRPSAATTGRITGAITVSSSLTRRRPRFRIYDGAPAAEASAEQEPEVRNVVVYLDSGVATAAVADSLVAARRRGSIVQEGERFIPHVLPVMQGATVDFPNRDNVFHNVFSLSSARQFDLGRFPRGISRSVTFPRSGTVQVFCHIHSDMSAVVLVLANPWFTTPSRDGQFVLDGVPAGDYTIVAWHERVRPVVRRVRVTAGATATIDFALPLGDRQAAAAP